MFLNPVITFLLLIDFNLRKKLNWIQAIVLSIAIIFTAVSTFAGQLRQDSCSGLYLQSKIGQPKTSISTAAKSSSKIRTENLLNYLTLLFNQQHVSLEALTNMLHSLEQGQLINPVSEKEALNSSIKKVIRDGIQSGISRDDLDIERLLQGLREIVKEETRQEERRGEARDKTNVAYYRAKFHEIRPGKFMMGENSFDTKQVETEITIPFAMMDTQVTQYMWARLKIAMGQKSGKILNPSYFNTGSESIAINIDGIVVQMKPDHPVEKVNWFDVKELIDRLNLLSNQGDVKMQELLEELFPGHQTGDVYDLPTEAQWEFVMRDRGNANKKYFDREDAIELSNYAWLHHNSGGQTHAVATRQARMIDGNPFYDLEGNVFEWVKDSWDDRNVNKLPGGRDPLVTIRSSMRVIRGGCLYDGSVRSGYRSHSLPDGGGDYVGFRLVRTRP